MNFLRNTDPDLLTMVGETALPPVGGAPQGGTSPMQVPPPNGSGEQGPPGPGGPGGPPPDGQERQSVKTMDGGEQKVPMPAKPPAPYQHAPVSPDQLLQAVVNN
jgi:hypothetical protein